MEILAIDSLSPMWDVEFTDSMRTSTPAAKETASFLDIYTSAIENVKTTDAEKNQMEYLLATGQLDNPAQLTIAATKAQFAVDLLVELRSKSLDVYNEIIKMQI